MAENTNKPETSSKVPRSKAELLAQITTGYKTDESKELNGVWVKLTSNDCEVKVARWLNKKHAERINELKRDLSASEVKNSGKQAELLRDSMVGTVLLAVKVDGEEISDKALLQSMVEIKDLFAEVFEIAQAREVFLAERVKAEGKL